MQNIVVTKPYEFVPPYAGNLWAFFLRRWLPGKVRRAYGVEWPTFLGADHLRASHAAGHGVILAPNHCRPYDPVVTGLLCIETDWSCWIMASWHLFMEGRVQRFLLRAGGAFSVYREGVDRESLKTAAALVAAGQRPLILFPEGIVSRSNDRLGNLMDGTAFIARSAAKVRARDGGPGKVVIHPICLRYTFPGDLRSAVEPVLTEIEKRLSWQPQLGMPLVPRVLKLGEGLMSVKEVEYLGEAQPGELRDRLPKLIEAVLQPLEAIYLHGKSDPIVIDRVEKLRAAIVPAMIPGDLPAAEAARRWRHLADCYFAQQLACYPIGYLDGEPTVERILETVERYEEDLTDVARIHRPLKCQIEVAPALEVSPDRPRGGDPLMGDLRASLQDMIDRSAALCHPWKEGR